MAHAIAEALRLNRHLIVEAPTGVGKSLAYLAPAIMCALEQKRKAIVSTHTKNLQEQLLHHDIEIVRSLLGTDFHAVVLKGRGNYLCTSRLTYALQSTGSLFGKDELDQLRAIHEWSLTTAEGELESLGFTPKPEIWEMVRSARGICSSKNCGPYCFFQRAKARVRDAHVIIMNHALFFTLMAIQGTDERYIFDRDFVIFDEAHTLESIAGAGIGKRLSRSQLLFAIHRLYNAKTRKGLLAKKKSPAREMCKAAEQATIDFFASLHQAAASLSGRVNGGQQHEVRVRTPGIIPNSIDRTLKDLQDSVRDLEEGAKDDPAGHELASARRTLWEAQILIDEFLTQADTDFTYWIEPTGKRGENLSVCASPSDIAGRIGPLLFKPGSSVIMTSATLSVDGKLDYFQRRMGAEAVPGMILDSPFDYFSQMKLSLARGIPEPDAQNFEDSLPGWIMQSIKRSEGKALVLFTSTSLMRSVAARLETQLQEAGMTLLVQGTERPRHALLEEFKHDIHSVLFGVESFWMGVDVPGEALEHVIITRLPFAVPSHPLVEARLEGIAKRGGNAFMEYTLPEAVLKFRQGAGRLLRSRRDKGMVTVLDSRILTKRYGRVFLSSLPRCPVEIIDSSGYVEEVFREDW